MIDNENRGTERFYRGRAAIVTTATAFRLPSLRIKLRRVRQSLGEGGKPEATKMINTLAGNEDTSPDWIWDSAGRIDDKGYTVEIRLPLQTIRFAGGADLQMGILFWRRISRTGVSVS